MKYLLNVYYVLGLRVKVVNQLFNYLEDMDKKADKHKIHGHIIAPCGGFFKKKRFYFLINTLNRDRERE